jgi:hypothetical protein
MRTSANESHALAVTYKHFTLGDIPSTDVLIKSSGFFKHPTLRQEKIGKDDWLRNLVLSKATHQACICLCIQLGDRKVFNQILHQLGNRAKQVDILN